MTVPVDSATEKRPRYLFFILACLVVYVFVGFYPFQFQIVSDEQLNNGVVSTPDEGMLFRSPGIAYTKEPPSWLTQAIATSGLELSLEVRTADQEQTGPARIFTFSLNTSNRNLTVGQEGTDLVVRMRHGFTSLNGTPNYTVKDVFTDQDWHRIDIRITPQTLVIRVDGNTRATAPLPEQHLDRWDPGYRLALGNELTGDRPWLGGIRKAVVHVGANSFDYLAPGALQIPEVLTVVIDRVIKVVPFVNDPHYRESLVDWEINLFWFMPFGWLLVMYRRPRPGVFLATVLSACLSATIETTQLLFLIDRFPSTEDLILNTLGGAMGAMIAEHFDFSVRRRRPT